MIVARTFFGHVRERTKAAGVIRGTKIASGEEKSHAASRYLRGKQWTFSAAGNHDAT